MSDFHSRFTCSAKPEAQVPLEDLTPEELNDLLASVKEALQDNAERPITAQSISVFSTVFQAKAAPYVKRNRELFAHFISTSETLTDLDAFRLYSDKNIIGNGIGALSDTQRGIMLEDVPILRPVSTIPPNFDYGQFADETLIYWKDHGWVPEACRLLEIGANYGPPRHIVASASKRISSAEKWRARRHASRREADGSIRPEPARMITPVRLETLDEADYNWVGTRGVSSNLEFDQSARVYTTVRDFVRRLIAEADDPEGVTIVLKDAHFEGGQSQLYPRFCQHYFGVTPEHAHIYEKHDGNRWCTSIIGYAFETKMGRKGMLAQVNKAFKEYIVTER